VHTSCPQPLAIGDVFGSIAISGATLESGRMVTGSQSTILTEPDLIYTLDGPDAAFFEIDEDTGEVRFRDEPDFENPRDAGGDNVYDAVVRATAKDDASCFTERPIQVEVKDVPDDEPPEPRDDKGEVCATERVKLTVLRNDGGARGEYTVTEVDGEEIAPQEKITLDSGARVKLTSSGKLVYDTRKAVYEVDGEEVKAADLLVGQTVTDRFEYTIVDEDGNPATAMVEVEVHGGKNTLETIAEDVPDEGAFSVRLIDKGDYAVRIEATGDERLDGKVFDKAYCLDADAPINDPDGIAADVSVGTAGSEPLDDAALEDKLDNIGYILNEDFGSQDNGDGTGETYTEAEIQAAIWGLTGHYDEAEALFEDGAEGTLDNAKEIYKAARKEGEGYEATEAGDVGALVFTPTDAEADEGDAQPS
jgi:hypothetical protein